MTDLQDRLARLAPAVDPEVALDGLHARARRQARRRRVGLASVATASILLAVAAAVILDRADSGRDEVADPVPVAGGWVALAEPPFRGNFGVLGQVWTGDEAIWWGRSGERGPMWGAAYDPESDSWRVIARSPLSSRQDPAVVWTGEEMVVWGGDPVPLEAYEETGAAYDPETDSWRVIADAPVESRGGPSAAMVGDELVVTGGRRVDQPPVCLGPGPCQPALPSGRWIRTSAAYDPGTDTWRVLADLPTAVGMNVSTTGTDTELLVFNPLVSYGLDVGTNRWYRLSLERGEEQAGFGPSIHAAGGAAILIDTSMTFVGNRPERDAFFLYDAGDDLWTVAPRSLPRSEEFPRCTASVAEVGDRLGVLGCTQALVDPATGEWEPLPLYDGEVFATGGSLVGSDDMLLAYGAGWWSIDHRAPRFLGYRLPG